MDIYLISQHFLVLFNFICIPILSLLVSFDICFLRNNFIYLCLAVLDLWCCTSFSLALGSRGHSICSALASHCGGCSCEPQGLGHPDSAGVGLHSCGSWALEDTINNCGPRASQLHSLWDLPRSGIEFASPALAGRFFTAEPPGKL